ncbi:MAG: TIM barrel protein [Planctomycetaceae bacterium]|nr:TIM barrel protein [Planctomycetales bacterium]MCB9921794.1 TIM barrel protein [Planctomycetaceae bacterium]
MHHLSRRMFLEATTATAALALAGTTVRAAPGDRMAYGLVTYLWGQDWDLPTLIGNCEKAGVLGVELRTTHAHGVEPTLNDQQRAAVRDRFADSEVTLVGIGSNERFDDPNPEVVRKAVDATKEFVQLSHDVGGTGVKVKPDRFHPSVPREKTIKQIGRSLNELGQYAEGFGQQIRLEVHGQCAELPTIKAIMDIADHDNVAVCWNSNPQDLQGQGLEHNLSLVRNRFGATCHVRELESPDYPYQQLIDLLVKSDYDGWIMLESSSKPADKVAALAAQVALFQEMVKKAQG